MIAAPSRRWEQPIEPDEEQSIRGTQPERRWCGPIQHEQLLAERCHLSLPRRTRSEHSDEEPSEQLHEVDHVATKLAHRCIGASPDEIFGSYNWQTISAAAA